jgi:hypothetical protein
MRNVFGVLALRNRSGHGVRDIAAPKNRQPNRSFWMEQASCPMWLGRKNDVGYPKPTTRSVTSTRAKATRGARITAASLKSHNRPRGMSVEEWSLLPEELTVRLLRFRVDIPGFRSSRITVATSLLDPVAYPAARIAALYRDRWLIELRFRDIKITLGMDVLRGKKPDIVRKEIYMHLLAYNMIRCMMWQAAEAHGRDLHRLSFAGSVDRLNSMTPYLWLFEGTEKARRLYELLLHWIAHDPNPDRPNRIEPRAVKRRPKEYDLLNKPRHQMRKELLLCK